MNSEADFIVVIEYLIVSNAAYIVARVKLKLCAFSWKNRTTGVQRQTTEF